MDEKQLKEILSSYFSSIRELLDVLNNHEKWRLIYQYMRKTIEPHIDEPAENILNYLTKAQVKVLQQALEDLGYTRDMLAEEQEEESVLVYPVPDFVSITASIPNIPRLFVIFHPFFEYL